MSNFTAPVCRIASTAWSTRALSSLLPSGKSTTVSLNVPLWAAASVAVITAASAAWATGTVKLTPVNDPLEDVAGLAGVVARTVAPIFTELMWEVFVNPVPARFTTLPAPALVTAVPGLMDLAGETPALPGVFRASRFAAEALEFGT